MVMKRGFTLLEMIFVIVISGILSIGSFKAFSALYVRSAKPKQLQISLCNHRLFLIN